MAIQKDLSTDLSTPDLPEEQKKKIGTAITPLGATLSGATEDQTKMMGTPAAKMGAIKRSSTGLAEIQQAAQEGRAIDEAAVKAQQKEQDLLAKAGTGFLDVDMERLSEVAGYNTDVEAKAKQNALSSIQASIQGLGTKLDITAEKEKEYGLTTDEASKIEALLNKGRVTEAMDMFRTSTADTMDSSGLSDTDAIRSLFPDVNESLLATVENTKFGLPEEMKASDIWETGSDKETTIKELFPDVELDKISPVKLMDMVQEKLASYNQVDNLKAVLADPFTGTHERQAAIQKLRELGATGTRSFENQIDQLEVDLMDDRATVEYDGEEYTYEELLSGENPAITASILSAVTDEKEFEKLKASQPGLAGAIEKYRDTFKTAYDNMSQANKTVYGNVAHNNSVMTIKDKSGNEIRVGDNVAQVLGINTASGLKRAVQPDVIEVAGELEDMGYDPTTYKNTLEWLAVNQPALLKTLEGETDSVDDVLNLLQGDYSFLLEDPQKYMSSYEGSKAFNAMVSNNNWKGVWDTIGVDDEAKDVIKSLTSGITGLDWKNKRMKTESVDIMGVSVPVKDLMTESGIRNLMHKVGPQKFAAAGTTLPAEIQKAVVGKLEGKAKAFEDNLQKFGASVRFGEVNPRLLKQDFGNGVKLSDTMALLETAGASKAIQAEGTRVREEINKLKAEYNPSFIIINGEQVEIPNSEINKQIQEKIDGYNKFVKEETEKAYAPYAKYINEATEYRKAYLEIREIDAKLNKIRDDRSKGNYSSGGNFGELTKRRQEIGTQLDKHNWVIGSKPKDYDKLFPKDPLDFTDVIKPKASSSGGNRTLSDERSFNFSRRGGSGSPTTTTIQTNRPESSYKPTKA